MTAPDAQSELLVLDTSVASEKFRGTFDEARYGYILQDRDVALPLAAVAELLQLPFRQNWGPSRIADLRTFIGGFTVLIPSATTAELWAVIRAECFQHGIAAAENDTWIAASALENGCELVSYDRDHQRMSNVVASLRVVWLEHTAANL